ncbi:MAG TPA: 3-hydroxyacyl-ACP dehydratase FabZ [Myxococcota bacterium]|nr:3-hydroxyacyl-ACP dehydratase FabZ [Myxococcota bacterium]
MEKLPFGTQRILELLPHRPPMLMIDRVVELGENYVRAEKLISASEPVLGGHFPGNPIFPGVLIIEAMAQAAGIWAALSSPTLREKLSVLAGIDGARFRKQVVPGDTLVLEARALAARSKLIKIEAKATVHGEIVAEAQIMAAFVPKTEGGER